MKINIPALVAAFLGMTLLFGCTKDKYDNSPLTGNWLLPLLKGEISPVTLSTLNNKEFDFYFWAEEAGLNTGMPISNPVPITLSDVGKFPIETTDIVEEIMIDTGLVELKITNLFPVTIKAGSIISLKTTGQTTALASLELTQDLAPGLTLEFPLDLSGKQAGNELSLDIQRLIIDSFSNKQFDNSYLQFHLFFKQLTIKEMLIAAQKSYEIRDTVEFNSSLIEYDNYDEMLTDSTIHATINFKASNNLPVNTGFQIYFLGLDMMVIDSLFSPVIDVEPAEYSGGGLVAPAEEKREIWIPKEKVDRIKEAVWVIYVLDLNTFHHHGAPLRVAKEQTLSIKATGDIQMLFNSSFIN